MNNKCCRICNQKVEVKFISPFSQSVTSDGILIDRNIVIYQCIKCRFLQKFHSLEDLNFLTKVYENYKIFSLTLGEDQINFSGAIPQTRSNLIFQNIRDLLCDYQIGTALDIGTGTGVFLKTLSECLPDTVLYAQDVGVVYRDSVLKIKNVKDFIASDVKNIDQSFDLYSMIHVLEHIENPIEFLNIVKSKMKELSKLIIQVPYVEENLYDLFTFDHVAHFTFDTLNALLEKNSFYCQVPEKQVSREITIIATLNRKRKFIYRKYDDDKSFDSILRIINSLYYLIYNSKEPISVFGTSPASIFVAGLFGERLAYFIDEDERKIGKSLFQKKIISPKDCDANIIVISPLGQSTSNKLKIKYEKLKFFIPEVFQFR